MTEHARKLFIGILLTFVALGLLLWAVQPALPARAGGELPARDTPAPRPANDGSDGGDKDSRPVGAYIELHLANAPAGAWTVVQWQDNAGGWRDVEGWRGRLDPGGGQRWWVAARDFGRGPFRWAITQGPDGALLGTSSSFYLPVEANQVVPVYVQEF